MNAYRLAQLAHAQIIERIADIQRRLLMNSLSREMFGPDALPAEPLYRSSDAALARAPELLEKEENSLRESLVELLSVARDMEAAFAKKKAGDMEAFAEFFFERFRAARAGEE